MKTKPTRDLQKRETLYTVYYDTLDGENVDDTYTNGEQLRRLGELKEVNKAVFTRFLKHVPKDIRHQFIVVETNQSGETSINNLVHY